ncbi:unnamed protein product [Haemonchus placei]|uniref:Uncharacterized protein n=1 Tax=Haemonchus placei TaxID=6290 RepID=A0A0N4W7T7_HAEPC|nr:unnamed protein product [Haemonchus placei]
MEQSAKVEQEMKSVSTFTLSTNRNSYGLSRQPSVEKLASEQNFRQNGRLDGRRQGVDRLQESKLRCLWNPAAEQMGRSASRRWWI